MRIIVIIPCYQQQPYLKRCLDSVLWQLRGDDEVIVVDDGNETPVLITAHPSVKIIRLNENKGVSFARNYATGWLFDNNPTAAADVWIKFLDADDVLAPFALDTFRSLALPPDVHVVSGQLIHVNSGVITGIGAPFFTGLRHANPALVSGSFIRQSALMAVNGFNERIGFEEDWDLWLRFNRHFHGNQFNYQVTPPFMEVSFPVGYYWRDDAEQAAKKRNHLVDGVDVREYFRKIYGCIPQG